MPFFPTDFFGGGGGGSKKREMNENVGEVDTVFGIFQHDVSTGPRTGQDRASSSALTSEQYMYYVGYVFIFNKITFLW